MSQSLTRYGTPCPGKRSSLLNKCLF